VTAKPGVGGAIGVSVRGPPPSDQDVAVASNGPVGKPAGPVLATTAIVVFENPVVKVTVESDPVCKSVLDCAAALLAPTVAAKNNNPNDINSFLIYSPSDFHNMITNYKDLTPLSGLGSPRLLLVRIFFNTVIP
jgi:hypothetical protein